MEVEAEHVVVFSKFKKIIYKKINNKMVKIDKKRKELPNDLVLIIIY